MMEKSFIGLTKPRFEYRFFLEALSGPEAVDAPRKATVLIDTPFERRDADALKKGDTVKTGQRLAVSNEAGVYGIAPVTGTVVSLTHFSGDFGRSYTAVTIEAAPEEETDTQFAAAAKEPSLENLLNYLGSAPGKPPIQSLADPEKPIHTLVVCGVDKDLMVWTNRYIIQSEMEAITSGIRVLKEASGVKRVIIAVSEGVIQGYGSIGAEVKAVGNGYPEALPHMLMQTLLGQVVPAGKAFEDLGVCFFSAEAVASIGRAFDSGQLPLEKTVTLIKKDGNRRLVTARIGTPVGDICRAFDIRLKDRDRIVFGGPMTGIAVYSADHPIQADTDAIIVQDAKSIAPGSDYPCINCGECIRICPVHIPVNMLVRFLEAGQYADAADQYDLLACIECGLCSFVCVSRIPILQYIKLGKHELDRSTTAEAIND